MVNNFVIKLGGSVVSTKDRIFDFEYIGKLKNLLLGYINKGCRFGVVLGGGLVMRKYRDLAIKYGKIDDTDSLHWIGTAVNVLHAEITRTVFGNLSFERPMIYDDYFFDIKDEKFLQYPVVIGGGAKAGFSGDMCALLLSQKLNSDTIISLKNIDYLYTKDPRYDKTAEIVKKASWDEYFQIIDFENKHTPGGNYIVDPIASKEAKKMNKKFVIIKGDELDNLQNYLSGLDFKGSIIG